MKYVRCIYKSVLMADGIKGVGEKKGQISQSNVYTVKTPLGKMLWSKEDVFFM